MSDVLVETAVFEVFTHRQRELDLLITTKADVRWSTHDLKEYMLKFETDVREAIKAAYKSWYLREHDREREEAKSAIDNVTNGEAK